MVPEWLSTPPTSTIFILLVSMVMTFASSLINRTFISPEHRMKLAALRQELNKLMKEKNETRKKAQQTGDNKLLKKVRKQERQILQLQSQMASLSFKQMRIFPITMAMFLAVWTLLTGRLLFWQLFDSPLLGKTVAYLPWLSGTLAMDLFLWYLICSLLFGALFARIFGLTGEMR